MATIEQGSQRCVQIRPGTSHPTLGEIGRWKGIVLRSFTVSGITYLDVELTAETLSGLTADDKSKYYKSNVVYTHFRVAQSQTLQLDSTETPSTREAAIAQAQREWYDEVGAHEHDPTQFVAARAAIDKVDEGRRQSMRVLIGFGVAMLIFAALSDNDCSSTQRGHSGWGRWGGGYSS